MLVKDRFIFLCRSNRTWCIYCYIFIIYSLVFLSREIMTIGDDFTFNEQFIYFAKAFSYFFDSRFGYNQKKTSAESVGADEKKDKFPSIWWKKTKTYFFDLNFHIMHRSALAVPLYNTQWCRLNQWLIGLPWRRSQYFTGRRICQIFRRSITPTYYTIPAPLFNRDRRNSKNLPDGCISVSLDPQSDLLSD